MGREDRDERVSQQREILEQSLKSLREKRELARKLRKANIDSAGQANRFEEIKTIEERYREEASRIEKAIKHTEDHLAALEARQSIYKKPVLVVDDEKNIRLTLYNSLESLGFPISTAVNGEEALQKLQEAEFGLLLLDLKMPGLDGMEVLRRVKKRWPKIRVIIITAHGTIESAVEAMKLGAVDFLQKPFTPHEIRTLVEDVMEREILDEETASDYATLIRISKRYVTDGRFQEAREIAQKAIAADPTQPESYNLLAVLFEIKGDSVEAQKFYRAALDIDPTYKPAAANLDRITSWRQMGKITMGPEE
jgi:FixJ family two-component response regulator